jgi:putative ABC transport system permease protein
MTAALRDRPVLPGPANGGAPARRAVARWAWRLFRREWRQQILVLVLLTLTVAAAAFSVSAAYNVASLPGPQFGSASYLLQFSGTSPQTLAADIAAAEKGIRDHPGDQPPVRADVTSDMSSGFRYSE